MRSRHPLVGVKHAVGVLLILAVMLLTVTSCSAGRISDGHPEQVAGHWKSNYWQCQVTLNLKSDGSFAGEVAGFPSLAPRSYTGTWFVDNGVLVLSQFVIIESDQPGSFYYTLQDGRKFEVETSLFGVRHLVGGEPFRFSRAG